MRNLAPRQTDSAGVCLFAVPRAKISTVIPLTPHGGLELEICDTTRCCTTTAIFGRWHGILGWSKGRSARESCSKPGRRGAGGLPASAGGKKARISLLLAKIPLYTAPSHTEKWLKRPSGGSRAIRLACSHVAGGTNRRTWTMALPDFSMRQLLEAGVHFGHQSHRWNPKMADYIFGARNNIHIIDLAQTVPLLHRALQAVSDTVAKGGRILFVGTKRQAQDGVAEAAKRSAQYFVNSRWLGGTLTNWKTISGSIKRLRHLEEVLNSGDASAYTKKERLTLQRERDKLDRSLGGIKDMGGLPDMIFVIDTNKEDIAIQEAQRLNIP